jgi:hypothetical protein
MRSPSPFTDESLQWPKANDQIQLFTTGEESNLGGESDLQWIYETRDCNRVHGVLANPIIEYTTSAIRHIIHEESGYKSSALRLGSSS